MELCDKTLDDVIKEFDKESHIKTNGMFTTVGYYIASQIFIQILEGVNHLHKQNPPLIHRDLKPENILLKKTIFDEIRVKIADFGLMAIHKYSGQSHTSDRGTLKYIAPETESTEEYDTKADIYSLGVIFNDIIDFETDHKNKIFKRSGSLSLYDLKYNAAVDIYRDMMAVSHVRPNCEEILEKKNSWALNEEVEISYELENIASKKRENEFTIYSLLKSKINLIKNSDSSFDYNSDSSLD
jgi:serine/threonine protein kinase